MTVGEVEFGAYRPQRFNNNNISICHNIIYHTVNIIIYHIVSYIWYVVLRKLTINRSVNR